MGTAKLRPWRYNLKIMLSKKGRRKEKRSQRHEHCLAGRRSLRPALSRRSSRFFPTLSFSRVCCPAIFESKLSVQLLRGSENTCRYVDQCGYKQTKKNLCSKNFSTQAYCRVADFDCFSPGWVPLVPLAQRFFTGHIVLSSRTILVFMLTKNEW